MLQYHPSPSSVVFNQRFCTAIAVAEISSHSGTLSFSSRFIQIKTTTDDKLIFSTIDLLLRLENFGVVLDYASTKKCDSSVFLSPLNTLNRQGSVRR